MAMIQPPEEGFMEQLQRRLNESQDYWQESFDIGKQDVERIYINFWDPVALADRQRRERATVTVNVLPQNIQKLVAALRKSKVDIHYSSAGGLNEEVGGMGQSVAQPDYAMLLESIARHITYQSNAPTKFANAAIHAAESGLGYLMATIDPSMTDPFSKEINIHHLTDRWSVFVDPFSMEPDFTDARYAFVREIMSMDDFKAAYPEVDAMAGLGGGTSRFTFGEEYGRRTLGVEVFDYYWKTTESVDHTLMVNGSGERVVDETEKLAPYIDDLEERGFTVTKTGKADATRVYRVRCTAHTLLEKPELWPGKLIPIIPVVGRRVDTESKSLFFGLVHYAIAIQQNMCIWLSNATEKAARSAVNPYIVLGQSIEPYREAWENMHLNRPNMLEFDIPEDFGPEAARLIPQRSEQAPLPIAELQMMREFMQLMPHSTGIHEAMLGQPSNETSGRAIEKRQSAGDDQLYDFIDNLATAVRGVGLVLHDLIPNVYRDNRLVPVRFPDESMGMMPVDAGPVLEDQKSGKRKIVNVLGLGQYACRVEVGPALISQRREMAQFVMKMTEAFPATFQIFGDLFFKGMDVPYKEIMSERFRRTVMDPRLMTPEEQQQQPPPPPDPKLEIEKAQLEQAQVALQGEREVQAFRKEIERVRLQQAEFKLEQIQAEADAGRNGGGEEQDDEAEETRMRAIVRDVMAEERRRAA